MKKRDCCSLSHASLEDIRTRGVQRVEAVELATLEWLSWLNHHRLLEPIGYIPLAEARENYYRC